ncbi:hypothetical protein [Spiroplasma endosymbiont of Megaselia nigra]|uniref:hypothetical protein n=1 Tax=Spiroplasma endosymbiont of Megaselia nigra TaxID=2478537 RepID=UPI000F860D7D|nr:hypothetical protein [Spiroplasma endosymbiont of Megaselia nigra]RUO86683.1 hypothetical protein D9R21_01560 [Spiroplasma endosymbiont of Megaselia nigra]
MGIIGRIIGVGEDSKQRLDKKWSKKNEKRQKEQEKLDNNVVEQVKVVVAEGREKQGIVDFIDYFGLDYLKKFVIKYPGIWPNEILPNQELIKLNSVNNVNSHTDLKTQKQILQLEKEKLAMQLEIERLKQSSNNVENNSNDSKINKLMLWDYTKEKANKVSDEDFERLEYWYSKYRKFFNDLLEIELKNNNLNQSIENNL